MSRLRRTFSRQRFAEFADKLGLSRLRQVPGIGWVITIAAIALLIQGVGLANLIAVNEEKLQWSAAANHREDLLVEIRELEKRQLDAKKEIDALHLDAKKELSTLKGMIDHESGRLAEMQAALKLTQQLRDEAQREQGAASSDASRLREANEAIAARSKELAARQATAEARVTELEAARDRLAAEVAASKLTLSEHRAEVDRAAMHAKDLDTQAAATLEAIRKSREDQIKAQAQLDDAVKQAAKAAADAEGAKSRLETINQQAKETQSTIDALRKQQATMKAALATDKKVVDELSGSRIVAEAELAMVAERLERAGKSLAEKQGAAAAEESLVNAAQARQDALKSRIANLQAELKPLEEQRLALEADVAGKRKELETLRERIEAARTDLKAIPAPALPPAVVPIPAPTPAPASKPAPTVENKDPVKPTDDASPSPDEKSGDAEQAPE